jgi:2-isopropylmalate synthase
MKRIHVYDTTLRDGTQAEDIAFTLEDKLRIAERLDDLGCTTSKAGWPGSNPRDEEFFRAVKASGSSTRRSRRSARPVARREGVGGRNLQLCIPRRAPVVTIVGKRGTCMCARTSGSRWRRTSR